MYQNLQKSILMKNLVLTLCLVCTLSAFAADQEIIPDNNIEVNVYHGANTLLVNNEIDTMRRQSCLTCAGKLVADAAKRAANYPWRTLFIISFLAALFTKTILMPSGANHPVPSALRSNYTTSEPSPYTSMLG